MAGDRAPSALHLLSLVRTETEAVITVVMRLHRPPDGAGTGWAMTHHLPYHQLWAVDDLGTRYTVRFEGGVARTATWRGIARLTPVPPRGTRWLDLVGDGTHLIQLPLRQSASRGRLAAPSGPAGGPEVFVPLADVLPDVDGARFALAGLSTAAGESHLHVVSSGMPRLAEWFGYDWTPGFSWWVRDGAGNWHVAMGRPTVHIRGRHAGVRAAADAAARRDPGRRRGGGDRTGDAGPRGGTDPPGSEALTHSAPIAGSLHELLGQLPGGPRHVSWLVNQLRCWSVMWARG